jgi:D-alanine-D-alanine ligase
MSVRLRDRRGAATLTVAVLAGGRSSEHEVSLSSGASVRDGLLARGHEVLTVEIGRDGVWRRDGEAISVTPGAGLLGADVVFPALHGPFGEDGTVQGMLEVLGVAYVGSGVAASALCMDKIMFKRLVGALGIPQVAHVAATFKRWREAPAQLAGEVAALGLPVFVKPARLGSSVGIAKVSSQAELAPALEQAFAHDRLVIVEAMASGLEVECGVLGAATEEADGPAEPGDSRLGRVPEGASAPRASLPGEIVISREWYDYEAKYEPGGMELVVPARISAAASAEVQRVALAAFAAAGCDGLARADFFVDGDRVLLNELNTMPGFTPTSVYSKLFDASGVPYPELVERLCRLGLERWQRAAAVRH